MRPERIRMTKRIAQQTVAGSFMGLVIFGPGWWCVGRVGAVLHGVGSGP